PVEVQEAPVMPSQEKFRARNIGSSTFLVGEATAPDPVPLSPTPVPPAPMMRPTPSQPPLDAVRSQNLRVRNMTPDVTPDLNSARSAAASPVRPVVSAPSPEPLVGSERISGSAPSAPQAPNASLRDFYARTEKREPLRPATP